MWFYFSCFIQKVRRWGFIWGWIGGASVDVDKRTFNKNQMFEGQEGQSFFKLMKIAGPNPGTEPLGHKLCSLNRNTLMLSVNSNKCSKWPT